MNSETIDRLNDQLTKVFTEGQRVMIAGLMDHPEVAAVICPRAQASTDPLPDVEPKQ